MRNLYNVSCRITYEEGKDRMKKRKVATILALCMTLQSGVSVWATDVTSTEETTPVLESQQGETSEAVVPVKSLVKTGFVPSSLSAPPDIQGEAAIVVDMSSGYSLYEKNILSQKYPASITKIMTATLALENLKMEDVVTFSHDAVYTIEPGSSSAYANEGEQLTVEQCLYGLMLISGNDLANGLGEAVAGSMEAFADKMTEKAVELGCIGTQFKNAHGLHDEGHYTTAYDMAIIGINAYKNLETFRTLCSTVRYDVPPTNLCEETRYWLNNNRMIRPGEEYYYEECIGGKTGFTNEAGGTLVTYANLNGREVVAVILKSRNSASAYADTIAIYDYIKNNITQEDYAFLDQKAAEDESVYQAALESISNSETTTVKQADVTTTAKKEKKAEKEGSSFPTKILVGILLVILIFYLYVCYRRYQLKQRKIQRRRRMAQQRKAQYYREKKLNKELEQRRKKYRNYEFSDRNKKR